MGVEGAGVWLGVPFVISVLVLLVLVISDRRAQANERRALGLGRSRIAAGYFGALGMLILLSTWETSGDPHPGMTALYVIVLGLPLIVFLTVVGLPLIALLRMVRLASVVGVTISGALLAIPVGLLLDTNLLQSAATGGLLGVAFSVAARLPLARSASARAS